MPYTKRSMLLPRLLLLLICSLMTLITCAQTKNDIPGKWKTVKVQINAQFKKLDPKSTLLIEKMMSQVSFQFNDDGSCSVDGPRKDMEIKNARWNFNETEKSISINGQVDGEKGLLMKIIVSQKNNKWNFEIFETPATLEVQKLAADK